MNVVRGLNKIAVNMPSGEKLLFPIGEHSDLQKSIIEEFLPRYGYGAEALYIGNDSEKYLFLNKKN